MQTIQINPANKANSRFGLIAGAFRRNDLDDFRRFLSSSNGQIFVTATSVHGATIFDEFIQHLSVGSRPVNWNSRSAIIQHLTDGDPGSAPDAPISARELEFYNVAFSELEKYARRPLDNFVVAKPLLDLKLPEVNVTSADNSISAFVGCGIPKLHRLLHARSKRQKRPRYVMIKERLEALEAALRAEYFPGGEETEQELEA